MWSLSSTVTCPVDPPLVIEMNWMPLVLPERVVMVPDSPFPEPAETDWKEVCARAAAREAVTRLAGEGVSADAGAAIGSNAAASRTPAEMPIVMERRVITRDLLLSNGALKGSFPHAI
jgi:hypothetical protein